LLLFVGAKFIDPFKRWNNKHKCCIGRMIGSEKKIYDEIEFIVKKCKSF
jgi:hypothetical protein